MDYNGDYTKSESYVYVPKDEIFSFIFSCLEKVGATSHEQISSLARVLYEADLRGHPSHGLNRLKMYIEDIQSGLCKTSPELKPEIVRETPSISLVNGHGLIGSYVGEFCMDIACDKAQATGISIVACYTGYYTSIASRKGLLGICLSNTSPCVIPTRGKEPLIGTNPIAMETPRGSASDSETFMLDMATSVVAIGKIEHLKILNETELPKNTLWGADSRGKPSTNICSLLSDGGHIYPLGGPYEINGGHKGYGLSLLVEVLTSVLSGPDIVEKTQLLVPNANNHFKNSNQTFIVIDPRYFDQRHSVEPFHQRLNQLSSSLRASAPIDPQYPVLIPGDPEKKHIELINKTHNGHIPYHINQIKAFNDLAKTLDVKPLIPEIF